MSEYENYVKKGTSNFNEKEDLPCDIYPITRGLPLIRVILAKKCDMSLLIHLVRSVNLTLKVR